MKITMKTVLSILISFLLIPNINSQDYKYKISEISDNLKQNSKAVIRNYSAEFEIFAVNKASLKINKVVSILNNNGLVNSYFVEFYDKFQKIKQIKGTVYDENGKKVKSLSGSDILDYSAINGFSLYEDNRVKFINPEYSKFPFTIEYTYEISFEGLLNYPNWSIIQDYNVSVEHSEFTVKAPNEIPIRYFEYKLDDSVKISKSATSTIYKWQCEKIPSIENEIDCKSLIQESGIVYLGPVNFEIEGYSGNSERWENFGSWIFTLSDGRTILNDDTQKKIKDLIKEAKSDFEKVKILYAFMQNRTRYVSIQIGLGGWQPFPAETVDRLSYGDCKALANYMKSILDVAGIKSYYTLVRAGENEPDLIKKFPSNMFNHAIVCVPLNKDTVWLECTNQAIPCGYIGKFTDDRDVLLIDQSGGELVHTKKYLASENQMVRRSEVKLLSDGNAIAYIKIKYIGLQCDKIYRILRSQDDEKKKSIYERIKIPEFNLIDFKYDESKDLIPVVNEKLHLNLSDYSTIIGD